ncbi:hypothetical protein LMH87_006788 [Akanthomyces muscarius]|uniref:Carcinoembryonic antigen-related cell adhesion molecule 1 n=1 Tax=Akanthomyces muscarius TaxID=2231603 RepID=A0A9W8UQN5_AKAMU|nr:hypothetical protein LMH87_006788 [Akanthomyces muscarius]KAJ4165142.1 hypothetical protein LMH87_006788 [Akanthomyces muscarius]
MSSKPTATKKSTSSSALPSLHSFPSTWTAPTSCFASTNYYRVLYAESGVGYVSNMYGTPTPVFTGNTPSGDCFPPSFTINLPYLTDGSACPTGYTRACATAGSVTSGGSADVSTITCCPSVTGDAFSFMCKDNQYGCHATAASGGIVWTGVVTNLGVTPATESPVTRTPSTLEGIEAWGIKFLSVAPGSTATSIPTPGHNASDTDNQGTPSADNSSNHGGLSGGAIAGIVVGSIAGVALLAVGAFLLYRRKKSSPGPQYHAPAPGKYPNQPANDPMYQPSSVGSPFSGQGQMASSYQPSEMEAASPNPAHAQPRAPVQQAPVELGA